METSCKFDWIFLRFRTIVNSEMSVIISKYFIIIFFTKNYLIFHLNIFQNKFFF